MKICKGGSRLVFLTEKYAIKIPRLDSWRLFLYGLLGNIHEHQWRIGVGPEVQKFLCPIIHYTPGGFLSIMPRCKQYDDLYEQFKQTFQTEDEETARLLSCIVEDKDDSVGVYNQQIVAIDYGS